MAGKDGRGREELTDEQRRYIREALRRAHMRPLPHACYRTGQTLALVDSVRGRIRYHEGMQVFLSTPEAACGMLPLRRRRGQTWRRG
jgi:hypothetical protein